MTKTFPLPGNGQNFLQSFFRALFLIAAAIGGFFIFAASAAFALFLVLGILILGLIAFGVLWLRAKILGKSLRPKSTMWTFQSFNGAKYPTSSATGSKPKADGATNGPANGPVLDAHKTPDGWSVDTD